MNDSNGEAQTQINKDAERIFGVVTACVATLGLVAMIVLGGNFVRVKDFRNPLNHVYVSLFTANTLFSVTALVGQTVRFASGSPRLPNWACQLEGAVLTCMVVVSMWSVSHIGTERYNIVIKQRSWSLSTHRAGILFTWGFVSFFGISTALIGMYLQHPGLSVCTINLTSRDPRFLAVDITGAFIYNGASIVVSVFCYTTIARAIVDVRSRRLRTASRQYEEGMVGSGAAKSIDSPPKPMIKPIDIQPALTALSIASSYFVTWTAFAWGIVLPEMITGEHAGGSDAAVLEPVLWMLIAWQCSVWDVVLISMVDKDLRAGVFRMVGRWLPPRLRSGTVSVQCKDAHPLADTIRTSNGSQKFGGHVGPKSIRTAVDSRYL
ncbi:family A G protein-coupled receptor-like protein [Gonapodya prolifera JEL478]|uniref:Family A G protein-coupled receptor-like protein n=1 Tax=Gonapodya prolifera (strain JEL478) TaxID=1344416 RepID=A0A139A5U2_GONPJ|nr:family A G protein-coupled receptor-like protein [Gonapodya prolifera JEL478]|eukprot:KXS12111.1 family A G protein-coupled receptor-like protein [Gonapodya prolifera JEL478]